MKRPANAGFSRTASRAASEVEASAPWIHRPPAISSSPCPQPHCPGEGHADAGYLCVYDGVTIDMTMPSNSISLPDQQQAGAAPEGFVLSAGTTTATGAAAIYGTWTVSGG